MDVEKFVNEFQASTSAYFSQRIEYTSVHALLVHWLETDLNLDNELTALRTTLEQDYNYTVATFPIPKYGSQQRLNLELSLFVTQYSSTLNSLVVVYYAGHAFTTESGEAHWSAYETDGPTLSWSACQQSLFGALGDVFLILDCCEAAVVSKGSKEQGRFEVLAASAKGVATPEPGPFSFTSFLIRELRRSKETGTTAKDLAAVLMENDRIQQTPYWTALARKILTSIPIVPLITPRDAGFMQKASSYAIFKASLVDDPTGIEIANWLKTAPPRAVTAVTIEAVVLRARDLQRRLDSSRAFPSDSIFKKLPEQAQNDILRELRGLNSIVDQSASNAHDPQGVFEDAEIAQSYNAIEQAVSAVGSAIETPLLLDFTSDDLQQALDEGGPLIAGISEVVALRRTLLEQAAVPTDLYIPHHKISFTDDHPRFRYGTFEGRTVLIEYYSYQFAPSSGEPAGDDFGRLERLASLLCRPKKIEFHILPCIGYTHDKPKHLFGLVFEPLSSNVTRGILRSLDKLYSSKLSKLTSLGQRIEVAYALTVAVENFHRIGWVHKALRSDNIIFLPRSTTPSPDPARDDNRHLSGDIDFSSPWLSGFEYARAYDDKTILEVDFNMESNLYRHPDRWGRPYVKFKKSHDVYSLGILLFEIANWKAIRHLIRTNGRVTPASVSEQIKAKCEKTLPFQVGETLTSTILICLNFEEHTQEMTKYEVQKFFQTSILGKLKGLVGRV